MIAKISFVFWMYMASAQYRESEREMQGVMQELRGLGSSKVRGLTTMHGPFFKSNALSLSTACGFCPLRAP